MFELDELIRELYIKYPELPKSEIELMCRTEFRFIWEKIQSGTFENINLKHLGKFRVKKPSKRFWEEKLKDECYIRDSQYYQSKKQVKTSSNKENV